MLSTEINYTSKIINANTMPHNPIKISNFADFAIRISAQGIIKEIEGEIINLLGYEPEHITGSSIFNYIRSDEKRIVEEFLYAAQNSPIHLEILGLHLMTAFGRDIPVIIDGIFSKSDDYHGGYHDLMFNILCPNRALPVIEQFDQTKLEKLAAGRENTVRKIIYEKDFSSALQPIVNVDNRMAVHYEALMRLNNHDVFQNPFDFILHIEKTGMIPDFDLAMMEKNLNFLRDNKKNGITPEISINLSGLSISSPEFMMELMQMLDSYEDVRRQAIIELTESYRIIDVTEANYNLQLIRKKGHKLCLDDFGTGAASFDYLRNIDVDIVKIDGQYVKSAISSARNAQIIKSVAHMCHKAGIEVIGEMVEDEAMAAFLRACSIDFAQGFYFGKPETDNIKLNEMLTKK